VKRKGWCFLVKLANPKEIMPKKKKHLDENDSFTFSIVVYIYIKKKTVANPPTTKSLMQML
jgi:hypothetical protein